MPVIAAPEHVVRSVGPWILTRFVTWVRPGGETIRFRSGLLYGQVTPKLVAGFLAVQQCLDLADVLRDTAVALTATGAVPPDHRGRWRMERGPEGLALLFHDQRTGEWKPRWRFTDPALVAMAAEAMAGAEVFRAEQAAKTSVAASDASGGTPDDQFDG